MAIGYDLSMPGKRAIAIVGAGRAATLIGTRAVASAAVNRPDPGSLVRLPQPSLQALNSVARRYLKLLLGSEEPKDRLLAISRDARAN